jgi:hypothetical protein
MAACVLSSAVALAAPAETSVNGGAPVEPLESPRRLADTVVVSDLAKLQEVAGRDPVVQPSLDPLWRRYHTAVAIGIGGAVLGAAIAVLGFVAFRKENCNHGFHTPCTNDLDPNVGVIAAGIGIGVVLPLVGYALVPRGAALRPPVDAWNERHPSDPLGVRE